MAASEIEVDINRGSQRQDKFRAHADPDSNGQLREVLAGWLDQERITDPEQRRRYTLTTFTNRLITVHL